MIWIFLVIFFLENLQNDVLPFRDIYDTESNFSACIYIFYRLTFSRPNL